MRATASASSSRRRSMLSANVRITACAVTARPLGDADVVVGDQREVRVTEAELPREPALGIGGHVHDLPALGLEPRALGPCREARALDHDDRPALAHRQPELPAGGQQRRAQIGAVGIGRRHVPHLGAVEEGVLAARRAIDELVANDERPGRQIGAQRARSAGRDDARDADRAQSPEVRAIGNAVRRELVPQSVPRQEGGRHTPDRRNRDRCRRRPVGRLGLGRALRLEQLVEPGAADDADHS